MMATNFLKVLNAVFFKVHICVCSQLVACDVPGATWEWDVGVFNPTPQASSESLRWGPQWKAVPTATISRKEHSGMFLIEMRAHKGPLHP